MMQGQKEGLLLNFSEGLFLCFFPVPWLAEVGSEGKVGSDRIGCDQKEDSHRRNSGLVGSLTQTGRGDGRLMSASILHSRSIFFFHGGLRDARAWLGDAFLLWGVGEIWHCGGRGSVCHG